MINFDTIIIRFGELSTKGKNKKNFIDKLFHNIKFNVSDQLLSISKTHDHIYIGVNDDTDKLQLIEELKNISGIYSFSLAKKVKCDKDVIIDEAYKILNEEEKLSTFKIKTHRIDKTFPIHSDDMNRLVATKILKNTHYKVDVHHPDYLLCIEIRADFAYIFVETILGLGGYPAQSMGGAMMLISGGIDSPVAASLLLKRGVYLEYLHFASPPYTNAAVIDKVKDLLNIVTATQHKVILHIVPFTKLQEEIYKHVDESYAITIMRRMMMRIACQMTRKRHLLAIATGESIGQVASQTLESMMVISKVCDENIIRPLATYDKNEVIKIAKDIGTYDISIRPYEDCCTIFTPRQPKTKPHLDKVIEFESKFNFQALVDECVEKVETIKIK